MVKRRIPENTSGYARWLAKEIEGRSSGIRLSPTTSLFVGMALEGYAELLDHREAADLPFVVTAIEPDGGGEVVAAAKNLHAATAPATIIARPGARVLLRHGVRLVSEHQGQSEGEIVSETAGRSNPEA
jgi:hypothetical protein